MNDVCYKDVELNSVLKVQEDPSGKKIMWVSQGFASLPLDRTEFNRILKMMIKAKIKGVMRNG